MVSTLHQDAAEFFDRDVKCLQDFFRRRLTITSIILAFYGSLYVIQNTNYKWHFSFNHLIGLVLNRQKVHHLSLALTEM